MRGQVIHRNTQNARNLRHHQTKAEEILWRHLRDRQLRSCKFRRQVPRGPYIVDFACLEARLVMELDGGHHSDQTEADTRRTYFLEDNGYRVLRFWNNEVLDNIEGVLAIIENALSPPSPRPAPLRGEGVGRRPEHNPPYLSK